MRLVGTASPTVTQAYAGFAILAMPPAGYFLRPPLLSYSADNGLEQREAWITSGIV